MSAPSPAAATLHASRHGKSRVRVAKVTRTPDRHTFTEYTVQIELEGGSSASFTAADNSRVVATDTCKNHVYLLAKTHPCHAPDAFALDLAARFLHLYPWLTAASVAVTEVPWRRASRDARPHHHAFHRAADGHRVARVTIARAPGARVYSRVDLTSALSGLSVLKTTQSGWANFVHDRFTTLPDTSDRILATTISAEWTYSLSDFDSLRALPFADIHAKVRRALLDQFYGPPDKGHFSPGVQNTLFLMAKAAEAAVPQVKDVTLSLPNLHFLPCNIPVFAKNDINFEDDVFIPTDEPHGIISATVGHSRMAKL